MYAKAVLNGKVQYKWKFLWIVVKHFALLAVMYHQLTLAAVANKLFNTKPSLYSELPFGGSTQKMSR